MLLAVNVGNTTTALGLFDGERRVAAWRLATERTRTVAEYEVFVASLFEQIEASPSALAGVAVASVVPPLVPVWRALARELCGREAYVYGQDGPLGIEVRVGMPRSQVGADRLCNAIGARALYGAPVIVVDIGTATTLDVVAQDGAFVGGAIAPGPATAAEGLYARAAKLPRVELRAPGQAIGRHTVEAMQSGMVLGLAGQVDGLVARTRAELGAPGAPVVATGGLAPLVAGESRTVDRIEPWLTFVGLRAAAQLAGVAP